MSNKTPNLDCNTHIIPEEPLYSVFLHLAVFCWRGMVRHHVEEHFLFKEGGVTVALRLVYVGKLAG